MKNDKNRLHNKSNTSEPSLMDWDIELPDWKLEPVDWDLKLGEWPTLTEILEPANSEMQGGEHE